MIVYGHRGAKEEAPENTLAGFAYARRLGAGGIELDVRLSADGELVVIHDRTVDRTTNATGPVAEFTAAELGRLDARGGHPDWPEPVGVPTLDEVLAVFSDPDAPTLQIEVKPDGPERIAVVCERLAAILGRAVVGRRVTVSSFDPDALRTIRRLAPDLRCAYIGAYDTPAFLDLAVELGCRHADIPLAMSSPEAVREAQARGLRVTGWFGNTPDELRALAAWGVDHIISDQPTVALAFLAESAGLGPTGVR
jgi:glycerophosphoryl diester phosphodiesterase